VYYGSFSVGKVERGDKMIIPALLTDDKQELIEMMNLCAKFTNYVQIDIMDGEFVPSKSITLQGLKGWKSPTRCEAHLMVRDPLIWIKLFKEFGAERIIYHFEIEKDQREVILQIKRAGLGAGIAINPQTSIGQIQNLIDEIDVVLFLSVNPGFYGSPFIPEVLEKIKEFKKHFPDKLTAIDGGVKLDNLKTVKLCGVDNICIGSAIMKAKDPKVAFEEFTKLLND